MIRFNKHALAVAFALTVALLAARPAHAKDFSITNCSSPYIAKTAGATYNVVANLEAESGDCIEVEATGIIINLGGWAVTGPCPIPSWCAKAYGVYIAPGATGAQIIGPGTIQGFNVGVGDFGNSALIQGMTIQYNMTGGVLLYGVDGSVVAENPFIWFNGTAPLTTPYGVLLENTTNSVVQYNTQISYNGNQNGPFGDGIWIQNNSTTTTLSSHNDVIANELNNSYNGMLSDQAFGIWVGYNNSLGCPNVAPSTDTVIVNNAVVDYNTQIGIGLQCNGAQQSTVMHNVTQFNGMFDLFDGNPGCNTDFWAVDSFGSSNQPGCAD